MNTFFKTAVCFFLLLIQAFLTERKTKAQSISLSDSAQISLITILPGEAPEELFGHSALRVHDPENHLDLLFNYGTFEFDSFFLAKFVYGELNYFLSVARTPRAMEVYRQRRRPVIEQELNLSAGQRRAMYDFLVFNAREENRYYRYDFLFDNCSTRIRDALQIVLEDDVRFVPQPDPGLSFRNLIAMYVEHRPFLRFGIDLLLGTPVDERAAPRDVMFLPDFLMEAFDRAEIRRDGEWQPLAGRAETILEIDGYTTDTNTALPGVSILFWALFLTGAVFTIREVRQSKLFPAHRWMDVPLFGFAGLVGLLIVFLWFFSLHDVTARNWNLLWAWPLHIVPAGLLLRGHLKKRWTVYYFFLCSAVCLLFLAGAYLLPQFIHPAVVPLLLLLALRSASLGLRLSG